MKQFLFAPLFLAALTGCEHIPGGSSVGIQFQIGGSSPTHTEAKALRAANRVLINGTPVDKAKYPSVVRIFAGNASCSANVVGPRAIITAAHCAETGSTVKFQTLSGKQYTAVMTRGTGYPTKDLDLNIGITSTDIDAAPMPIKTDRFEAKGMSVQLIGYGCINPDGSGGNDGILRTGQSVVTAGSGYDLVLNAPNGAALCYGDSGGPVLWTDPQGVIWQIGVNSKGNIVDTSYTTRTTLDEARAFISGWAQANAAICGVSASCGGGATPPPVDPPPGTAKSFQFGDGKISGTVTIQGI